jgi:hypothetical protein
MPEATGLADNLTRAEFTHRYGDVGSPAYTRPLEEIDRRIAALPLFQMILRDAHRLDFKFREALLVGGVAEGVHEERGGCALRPAGDSRC